MFFDDDQEKKLFEDLKFKRQVAFIDDDNVNELTIKPFSRIANKEDLVNKECQVSILNSVTSTGINTRPMKHKEVQTEVKEEDINEKSSNLNKVFKILSKKSQLIEDALIENNKSTAFSNYDVDWSGGGSSITNPFTLVYQQLVKDEELQITGLEWNQSGTTIYVGYGRYDHESVCTHKAALCSWNIDRLKINPNKPDMSIETSCCISSLSTHPEYPSVIAVGFFNGELHVYNTRETDSAPLIVSDKREMHKDEITVIKWIKDVKTSKKKYLLLSGSKDGKILIWNPLPAKNQIKLTDGFRMLVDYLPRSHLKSMGTEMGISNISMNNEDKDTFVVGCDSGGLFKCSLSSETQAQPKWEEDFPIELKSPVKIAFDPQFGPIYSISSSPFHRNLVLTCGTDSEIKLYSLLQTSSLMNLCPDNGYLYSIEWSPSRPCVFACGTHKGNLLIYDLSASSTKLNVDINSINKNSLCTTIQASTDNKPIHLISFSQQRPGYLCTGDRGGVVKIWRLSQELSKADMNKEIKKLNEISENKNKIYS